MHRRETNVEEFKDETMSVNNDIKLIHTCFYHGLLDIQQHHYELSDLLHKLGENVTNANKDRNLRKSIKIISYISKDSQ